MSTDNIEELRQLLQNCNVLPEEDQIIFRRNIQNRIDELTKRTKTSQKQLQNPSFQIPKSPRVKRLNSVDHLVEKSRLLNSKWVGKLDFNSKNIPFNLKISHISPTGTYVDVKVLGYFKIFIVHTHMKNKFFVSLDNGDKNGKHKKEFLVCQPRPYYNFYRLTSGTAYRLRNNIDNVDVSHIDFDKKNVGTNRCLFYGTIYEGVRFEDEIYGQITFEEKYCILEFIQEYDYLQWTTNGREVSEDENKISFRHFYLTLDYEKGRMNGKHWTFERDVDSDKNASKDHSDLRIHHHGKVSLKVDSIKKNT